MIFVRKSILTGIVRSLDLDVTQEQALRYDNGWHVQDAYPHLSADDREFLISGVTAEEWSNAFGDEEE